MNSEKLGVPAAIIVAGLIIAGAVVATGVTKPKETGPKPIGAQLGLNETKLQACITAGTTNDVIKKGSESGDRAMAPADSC